jgi:uncharacterized membrane protein
MDRAHVAYLAYMLFFLILAGSALIVPILAFNSDMDGAYAAFGPTCHQKLSRSLCVFRASVADGSAAGGYWVADCTLQGGGYVNDYVDRTTVRVETQGATGYKMPICARDFGIYGAMLLAGAIYPFVRRVGSRAMYPAFYLLLAMVPLALDGGIQLATELDRPLTGSDIIPFEYESTNAMRLLTGAIAGFAASFYAIPVLVNVFSPGYELPPRQAGNPPSPAQGQAVLDAPAAKIAPKQTVSPAAAGKKRRKRAPPGLDAGPDA